MRATIVYCVNLVLVPYQGHYTFANGSGNHTFCPYLGQRQGLYKGISCGRRLRHGNTP